MVWSLPQEQPHRPTCLRFYPQKPLKTIPLTITTQLTFAIMHHGLEYIYTVNISGSNSDCGDTISRNKTVSKSDEDAQITRLLSPLELNN